jgi:solute:Na+ symporter, SSS family
MVLASLEDRDYATLSARKSSNERACELKSPVRFFPTSANRPLPGLFVWSLLPTPYLADWKPHFIPTCFKGVFIIILSFILIPFSWIKIKNVYGNGADDSAMSILHDKLPQSFFEIFGSPTLIDFTWYFIIVASLVAGITVVAQPNQLVTMPLPKMNIRPVLAL